MSESLAVGELVRAAVRDRYGDAEVPSRFRAFDTICSATQERQDAVLTMLADETLDLMVVVGGYNSSNTCNLARICAEKLPTFHIADPDCLVSEGQIRHRPIGSPSTAKTTEAVTDGWLPQGKPVVIGLTAGASTPNNLVGQTIRRLEELAG